MYESIIFSLNIGTHQLQFEVHCDGPLSHLDQFESMSLARTITTKIDRFYDEFAFQLWKMGIIERCESNQNVSTKLYILALERCVVQEEENLLCICALSPLFN